MQGGYPHGMGMGFRGPNMGSFAMGQNPTMMNQGFGQNVRPQPMVHQHVNPINTGHLVAYPSTRMSNPAQAPMAHGSGGGFGGQWGIVGNNVSGSRHPVGGGPRALVGGGPRPPVGGGPRPTYGGSPRPPFGGGPRPSVGGGPRPPYDGGPRAPVGGGPRPLIGGVVGYGAGRLPQNSFTDGYASGGPPVADGAGNNGMVRPPSSGGGGFPTPHSAGLPRLGTKTANPFDDFFNKPFHFQGAPRENPLPPPPPPPPPPPNTQVNPGMNQNSQPNSFCNPQQNSYGGIRPPPPASNYIPPPPPPPVMAPVSGTQSGVKAIDYDHGRQQFEKEEVDQALSEILNYPGTGPVQTPVSAMPNFLPPKVSQKPEDTYDAYGANIEREFLQEREREERRKRALPIPRELLDANNDRRETGDRRSSSNSDRQSRRSRSPPPLPPHRHPARQNTPNSGTSSAKSTPPPPPPPPPPAPAAPPPKAETVVIDDILCDPGRKRRPRNIAIIIRGAPGSGKSHLAKLIKEKEHAESSSGGTAPRVLSIDDFFCTDVEKLEKNPKTGKMTKVTKLVYEYDEPMEPSYYKSLLKMFKKNVEQGFYPFLIVDAVFQKLSDFEEYWSFAKSKGYQVYVVELVVEASVCAKRNIHDRTLADLTNICSNWVKTPDHMINLDVRTLLQDDAIQEVEMEDAIDEPPTTTSSNDNADDEIAKGQDRQGSGDVGNNEGEEEEDDINDDEGFRKVIRSKWDGDVSETNLDLLDGLSARRRRDSSGGSGAKELRISMEDFLEAEMHKKPKNDGKKRVRWVDIEEMKEKERLQAIGFVVGQSKKDWQRMTEAGMKDAQSALEKTRFIPHRDDDKEVVLE